MDEPSKVVIRTSANALHNILGIVKGSQGLVSHGWVDALQANSGPLNSPKGMPRLWAFEWTY